MAVGWFASRRVREGTAADLIVAGRAMPFWVAALTMTATWVDGGYLLGTTEGAYKSSLQLGIQGGLCFGISLILGGVFFAAVMRRFEFTTLIDPLEARFGKRWAAVLFLPALAGELFWSAELLVAIGSTFGVLLGMPLTTAILLSAAVTTAYTVLGGMWSVAYTDIFQLGLVALGLAAALPYVLDGAGSATHGSLDARFRRRLVGRLADADLRRHSVELLLPARAVVPDAARREASVDSGRRADDRVHCPAAVDGNCCLRVSVASRYRVPSPGDACGRDAAAVRASGAARHRSSRTGGDHRRRDV
jgi:hypothetical protein